MTEDDEAKQGPDSRVKLTDRDERLFRQVLLPLRDGRPSWENFKGRKHEDWQVSVDRQSRCPSAEAAYDRYTAQGARSHGVLATSVGALDDELVESYEAPLVGNQAHCQYDLAILTTGQRLSHGRRERICVKLHKDAIADEDHPPYLPS